MTERTITVTVLVRSTWTPELDTDLEYPTIESYADRVREQFETDPLGALSKLPNPEVVTVTTDIPGDGGCVPRDAT